MNSYTIERERVVAGKLIEYNANRWQSLKMPIPCRRPHKNKIWSLALPGKSIGCIFFFDYWPYIIRVYSDMVVDGIEDEGSLQYFTVQLNWSPTLNDCEWWRRRYLGDSEKPRNPMEIQWKFRDALTVRLWRKDRWGWLYHFPRWLGRLLISLRSIWASRHWSIFSNLKD